MRVISEQYPFTLQPKSIVTKSPSSITFSDGTTGAFVDKAGRDIIEAEGYGSCFGHSFGHGIGIDIHELPLAAPRYEKILCAGNIISAEPGIYIPERFGVRIEDMLCITPDGCRDLTNAPKQLTICK